MQRLSVLQADKLWTEITYFFFYHLCYFCFCLALWGHALSDGLNDMGCSSSAEQGLFSYVLSFRSYGGEKREVLVFFFLNEAH